MDQFTEQPPVRPYGPPIDQDDLTKLTVWIVPTAIEAMNVSASRFGDTRTDTINRALIWYEHSTRSTKRGIARRLVVVAGLCLPLLAACYAFDVVWPAAFCLPALPIARWLDWRPR